MVSPSLSLSVCVCVCVCVRGWAGACTGGVRFSNSNRIIPSDYRILLLLKMPIPNIYIMSRSKLPQGKFLHRDSPNATCFATDISVSNARKFKSVQKLFKVPFIINV